MGWTLLLVDEDGVPLEESQAGLDDELAEYLAGLDGFPTLQALRDLPREEDTPLPGEVREALAREVAELAARAKRREPRAAGLGGARQDGGPPLGRGAGLARAPRLPPAAGAPAVPGPADGAGAVGRGGGLTLCGCLKKARRAGSM